MGEYTEQYCYAIKMMTPVGIRDGSIVLNINNKDISKLYCNRKEFFNEFINKKKVKRFKVIQDETLGRGNIIIKKDENQEHIFIKEYMRKLSEEGKNLFI